MTEATFSFAEQTDDYHASGSVGVIRKGLWGKTIDPETGHVLGPNCRGELCFKGMTIMKGYVDNELATNAAIDADGWLHTGDYAYYDENGEIFVIDRIREWIKHKEFKVAPAEIESVLLTHSGINDVGVIGVPDVDTGELALAFVVQQPNANLSREEVIQYVAGKKSIQSNTNNSKWRHYKFSPISDRVSSPKKLHGGVIFVSEIPKTASGKILRRILRERFEAQKD